MSIFESSLTYTSGKVKLSELVRRDGALCATFVNTTSSRRQALASYADLLAWSERHGALGSDEVQSLRPRRPSAPPKPRPPSGGRRSCAPAWSASS